MTRTFSKIYALGGHAARLGLLQRRAWPTCSTACASPSTSTRAGAGRGHRRARGRRRARPRARAQRHLACRGSTRELDALGLEVDAERRRISCWCVSPTRATQADAAFEFLQSRGILTRKVAAYGLPEHLRITIGTEDEMRAVVAALAIREGLSAAIMSDLVLRARGAHRHRAHRLVAGARAAPRRSSRGAIVACARTPGDARHGAARWTSPTRSPLDPAVAVRGRRSRRHRARRIRPMPRSPRRIAPALEPGAILTDVGSVKGAAMRDLAAACAAGRASRSRPSRSRAPSIPVPRRASPRCSTAAGAS